jgi:tetraacyldisaccharide 4'-kinase
MAVAGHEAPPFWYGKPGWQTVALSPISWVYGSVARFRMDRAVPPAVDAPVLCIGNLTVGGSGKTPAAIAFAEAARKAGHVPGFLTRGYGGSHQKPHIVDTAHDSARSVGDEPLILARRAMTVVSRNRAAGAERLVEAGADFIIMDDGFQSRGVHYDYALIAVDARRGAGNGAVIPAGPLRAPVVDQMRHADAVLRIGEGSAGDAIVRAAARAAKPIHRASLHMHEVENLRGRKLLPYAGIGDPKKFFDSLEDAGCNVAAVRSFADHHVYTRKDAEDLIALAAAEGLDLVTTEKDMVRLDHSEGPLAALRRATQVAGVALEFDQESDPRTIVDRVVARYEERRIGAKS